MNEQIYSTQARSTINPGNLTGDKNKKEVAEPYAKIEAKFNEKKIEEKPKKKENEIWDEKEFIEENIKEDGRPQPKFEVLYKQTVSTEDIYLGMSGKDVSSNSCDQLLMKIWLPNTLLKEIGVEVKDQSVHLQCPEFLLNHILPYKVDKEKSDAKWDKDKGLLAITVSG